MGETNHLGKSKLRSYESLHVDSSTFQASNHPFRKPNWTKQIFPTRRWTFAVVVAVPSLTAVLPTSQCLARWQREGSKHHPSRKRWNWNQEPQETQNQTEKQYSGQFFFCKRTHAERQGRLKLSGKKQMNLSYPSLSGTLPPTTYAVRNAVHNAVPYPIIATPASAADPQHTPQRWKPVTSLRAAHAWYSTIHFITEVARN